MKILFLDIDGVMNNARSSQTADRYLPIEPYAVLLLDRIIQATGCQVVLSSSWRHMLDWKDMMKRFMPSVEFLDKTPRVDGGFRGDEILKWIIDFEEKNERVEVHAILDDNLDFHRDQPLFKTSWPTGLTEEIAQAVIAHLNKTFS